MGVVYASAGLVAFSFLLFLLCKQRHTWMSKLTGVLGFLGLIARFCIWCLDTWGL